MEILNILYCPIFLKKCMSYIYYMKSVIYYLFPISKKNLSGHVVTVVNGIFSIFVDKGLSFRILV